MAAPVVPDRPNLVGTNSASNDTIPDVDGRGPDYLDLTWPTIVGVTGYDARITNPSGSLIVIDVGPGVRLNGLQPNTRYALEVRSKNNDGISDWSSSRDAFTRPPTPARPFLEGTPPASNDPRPQDVLTDLPLSRSTDSLVITWSPISGISTFEIEIDGGTPAIGSPGERHTGLSTNALHKFRLRSIGVGGKSFWSEARDVFTRPPSPNLPFLANSSPTSSNPIPDVDSRGPDFLLMQWNRTGGFDRYLLQADGGTPVSKRSADVDHKYSGFAPNTSHSVRLRVADDAKGGLSFWSATATYRTRPPTVPSFQKADFKPLPRGVAVQWLAAGAFNEDTQAILRVHKVSAAGDLETVGEIQQPAATKSGNTIDLFLPVSGALTYFSIIDVGSNLSFKSEQFSVDVLDIPSWGYELLTPTWHTRRRNRTTGSVLDGGHILYMNDPGSGGGVAGPSGPVSEGDGKKVDDNNEGGNGNSSNNSNGQINNPSGQNNGNQKTSDSIRDNGNASKSEENAQQAKPQQSKPTETDKLDTQATKQSTETRSSSDTARSKQISSEAMPYSSVKPDQSVQDPLRRELIASEPPVAEASWETKADSLTPAGPKIERIDPNITLVKNGDGKVIAVQVELPNSKAENAKVQITVAEGEDIKVNQTKDGSYVQVRVGKTNTKGQKDYEEITINTANNGKTQVASVISVGGKEYRDYESLDVKGERSFSIGKSSIPSKLSEIPNEAGRRSPQSGIRSTIVYSHDAPSAKPPVEQAPEKKPLLQQEKNPTTSVPQKAQADGQILSQDITGGKASITMTKTAKYNPEHKSPVATLEKGLGDKQDRLNHRSMETYYPPTGTASAPQEEGLRSDFILDILFDFGFGAGAGIFARATGTIIGNILRHSGRATTEVVSEQIATKITKEEFVRWLENEGFKVPNSFKKETIDALKKGRPSKNVSDLVLESEKAKLKIHFDFTYPKPHVNPHIDILEKLGKKWSPLEKIYPKGVKDLDDYL